MYRCLLLTILALTVGLYGCASIQGGGADTGDAVIAGDDEQSESGAAEVAANDVAPAEEVSGTVYGDGVTLTETTQISAIFDDVDSYDGQRVRVEGLVTDVCEMRGCWLAIASDREYEDIRLKVQDGVIVFPMSARGQHVVAEGIVRRLEAGQGGHGMHAGGNGEHEGEHEGEGEPKRDGSGGGAGGGTGESMNADAVVQLEGLGAVIRDQS